MDGISALITIIFLLILTFIGLLKSETILGVFGLFILLTFIEFVTIYLFNAN
jgi:hypothetical protein